MEEINNMERKGYVIFKRAICNELLAKGFKLIKVGENVSDQRKSVFIFEITQELIDYMLEIKKRNIK